MVPSNLPDKTRESQLGSARVGIGAAYGLGEQGVLRAFERGVRFFLWGALPKASFGAGLKQLARHHRAEVRLAIQSYSRRGWTLRPGVELALWRLGTDYLDWLCLANWSELPSEAVLVEAQRLKERGLVRHIMISCHHRPTFASFARQRELEAWMVRYNAAHRRAESEVFPLVTSRAEAAPAEAESSPAIIAYTALRWGTLLDPRYAAAGEPPLTAVEAYRFVLSHPAVSLCLAGPRDDAELDAALAAMDAGPLDEEGLRRARRVGDAAYEFGRAQPPPRMRDVLREGPALVRSLLREGVTENLLSRFNR